MKRIELFEFEDMSWLPTPIRTGATNLIIVFHKLLGTKEVVADLILDVKKKQAFSQIIDMGSGSGGPMMEAIKKVNQNNESDPVQLLLSDINPHPDLVKKINARNISNVKYHESSVDATNPQGVPSGLKTMIASFHHMSPGSAKKILLSAQASGNPILIYELAKNNIPFIVWLIFLPISLVLLVLMSIVMTIFVRPFTWQQLLFTIIPIIPIIYAWDGQASLMRTYTFDDIESLLEGNKNENYVWEIGDAKNSKGKKVGYFIKGYSKSN